LRNNTTKNNIHFAYYSSLMAIHSAFTIPWITAMFGSDPAPAVCKQVSTSTSIVAEAARNIILKMSYINIDAASPAWLSFYFPLVGLINLFVSIIANPGSATASDVALLGSAAGHFGYMEFMTQSEQAFAFASEVAALARAAVQRDREGSVVGLGLRPGTSGGGGVGAALASRTSSSSETPRIREESIGTDWNVCLSAPYFSRDYLVDLIVASWTILVRLILI
jgi:hypothetical protein